MIALKWASLEFGRGGNEEAKKTKNQNVWLFSLLIFFSLSENLNEILNNEKSTNMHKIEEMREALDGIGVDIQEKLGNAMTRRGMNIKKELGKVLAGVCLDIKAKLEMVLARICSNIQEKLCNGQHFCG